MKGSSCTSHRVAATALTKVHGRIEERSVVLTIDNWVSFHRHAVEANPDRNDVVVYATRHARQPQVPGDLMRNSDVGDKARHENVGGKIGPDTANGCATPVEAVLRQRLPPGISRPKEKNRTAAASSLSRALVSPAALGENVR